jgi:hypothetical protein
MMAMSCLIPVNGFGSTVEWLVKDCKKITELRAMIMKPSQKKINPDPGSRRLPISSRYPSMQTKAPKMPAATELSKFRFFMWAPSNQVRLDATPKPTFLRA